jgi:hypothetical protein
MMATRFGWLFIRLNIYTGGRGDPSSPRRRYASGRSMAGLWAEKNLGPSSVM